IERLDAAEAARDRLARRMRRPPPLGQREADRLPEVVRVLRRHAPSVTPHERRIAVSSAALVAFLNRAPVRPFTRRSHSAHVACRISWPSMRLKYEYA